MVARKTVFELLMLVGASVIKEMGYEAEVDYFDFVRQIWCIITPDHQIVQLKVIIHTSTAMYGLQYIYQLYAYGQCHRQIYFICTFKYMFDRIDKPF